MAGMALASIITLLTAASGSALHSLCSLHRTYEIQPEHAYRERLLLADAVLKPEGSQSQDSLWRKLLNEMWNLDVVPMFEGTQGKVERVQGDPSINWQFELNDAYYPAPAAYSSTGSGRGHIVVSPRAIKVLKAVFPFKASSALLVVLFHELIHHWQQVGPAPPLNRCAKETQAVALTDLFCAWAKPPLTRVHRKGLRDLRLLERVGATFQPPVEMCYCEAVRKALARLPSNSSLSDLVNALSKSTTYAPRSTASPRYAVGPDSPVRVDAVGNI